MYYCHTWMPLGLTSSIKFCLLSKPFLDVFVSDTIEMNKKQSQTHLTLHTWHRTSLLLLLRTKLQNVNVFPSAAKLTLAYPVFFLLKINVSLNNFSIRHRFIIDLIKHINIYIMLDRCFTFLVPLWLRHGAAHVVRQSPTTREGEKDPSRVARLGQMSPHNPATLAWPYSEGCQIGRGNLAQSGNPRCLVRYSWPCTAWAKKQTPTRCLCVLAVEHIDK